MVAYIDINKNGLEERVWTYSLEKWFDGWIASRFYERNERNIL